MAHEASFEDLCGLMFEDERLWFDAPERTENERKEMLARLQTEWQEIRDPTLADLMPPYMPQGDWAAYKNGSSYVIPFYTRQWKRQRRTRTVNFHDISKAVATFRQWLTEFSTLRPEQREQIEKAKHAEEPKQSPEQPPKQGIEVSELEKSYEDSPPAEQETIEESLNRLADRVALKRRPEDLVDELDTYVASQLKPITDESLYSRLNDRITELPLPTKPDSETVRPDGYTDAQVADYFENKYVRKSDRADRTTAPSEKSARWFSRAAIRTFVGTVVIALGLVAAALAAAGVVKMGWTHLFLFFAWVVTVAGVCVGEGFEDKTAKEIIRLGCLTAFLAGVVLFAVDRLIVSEKAEEEARKSANVAPTQTPVEPTTGPFSQIPKQSPSPITASIPTDHFNARINLKEGVAVRLSNLLSQNGYHGALNLDALEFHNPSEVNICWRTGVATWFRCLAPSESYSFPGGANAENIWVEAEIDSKPTIKFLDIGLKATRSR